jgi:sugar/nucleoside kinase (ribokinase family)
VILERSLSSDPRVSLFAGGRDISVGVTPDVVVIGQLSIDDVILPDGRTAMALCGGDATYAALGAALWTSLVGVVAPAGRDFPPDHLEAMVAWGLDLDGIQRRSGPAIRYRVTYEADGTRMWLLRSAASSFRDTAPGIDDVPASFRRARAFHLAAMPFSQVELLIPAIRTWMPDAIITLDTHEDEIAGFQDRFRAILPMVSVFLPSREEVASWFGRDDPQWAIGELALLGQRGTIIKMGAEGSLVHDPLTDRMWQVGTASGGVTDVTGAGDAFCGGVIAGLAADDTPADAARRGAAAASLAIAGFGALHGWARPDEAARRAAIVPFRELRRARR